MAALIFSLIVGGWMLYARHREASVSLPDDQSFQGACSLWFVGSSSIHRWSGLHRDMAPWVAHNRGINGATFTQILPRFAHAQETPPTAIILYAGENDIADGVSVRDTVRQLSAFLDLRSRKMANVPVVVMSLKPSPGRRIFLKEQQLFNDAARRLVKPMPNTYYADIVTPMLKGGGFGDNYRTDGVHMNAAGYRIWASVIHKRLAHILPADTIRQCAQA